jgi:FixJ family two-component response regulator
MSNKARYLVSIVDDDESIREATEGLLRSNGFRTKCFSSAEEFIASPFVSETTCVILDIKMPGMSGIELQSLLAQERLRIPIIFITAHGDRETRKVAIKGGAVAFIIKPFSEEALLSAIRSAIGAHEG